MPSATLCMCIHNTHAYEYRLSINFQQGFPIHFVALPWCLLNIIIYNKYFNLKLI